MYTRGLLVLTFLVACSLPAQEEQHSIQVTGTGKQALILSASDLARMPRASVRMISGGTETAYEGVWLHEVLKTAGVPQGSDLRGKALARYVLADAQDGY